MENCLARNCTGGSNRGIWMEYRSPTIRNCTVYGNLLPTQHVIIQDHGVITKNIPIDPTADGKRSKIYRWRPHLGKGVQVTLAYAGPFVAFGIPWFFMRTSVLAWIAFVVYAAVSMKRLTSFKPAAPPFGTVRDAQTARPVERAVVRIFDASNNKVLETQVTSPKGRYAFMVRRGAYYVVIRKDGYRTVRLNFPRIAKDGFLLVRDVPVHQLGTSEKDPLAEMYGGMSVPD